MMNTDLKSELKQFELIRELQSAEGNQPCFGTKKICEDSESCMWKKECLVEKNKNLYINFSGGSLFFAERGLISDLYKICLVLNNLKPELVFLSKLRIYFVSKELGILFTMIKENLNSHAELNEFENLPDDIKKIS